MSAQDLYVFMNEKHADYEFPRRERTADQVVVSANLINSSPEYLYGRRLKNVYLYAFIEPVVRAVILSRMERDGPSRLFEAGEPKPPLPHL